MHLRCVTAISIISKISAGSVEKCSINYKINDGEILRYNVEQFSSILSKISDYCNSEDRLYIKLKHEKYREYYTNLKEEERKTCGDLDYTNQYTCENNGLIKSWYYYKNPKDYTTYNNRKKIENVINYEIQKKYPKEESVKNKFDCNINTKKYNNKPKYNQFSRSRKYSKDSSNISTSYEDIQENNEINNNNFKGTASDFKIKYKTELCKYYEMTGHCKYGDNCAFAHGTQNLRSKVTNTTAYRTKKCVQFFEKGYCPYGNRCQFQHQLKNNILNNPYDKEMNYSKILDIISKIENVRNIKKLVEKPRLNAFKEITGDIDNKSRLLDDIKELDIFWNYLDI